jgi:hypothetical protein
VYSWRCGRKFAVVTFLLAGAAQAHAQSLAGPRPSVLWAAPSSPGLAPLSLPELAASSKTKGLLIGAIIGGAAAGFLGNRVCHAYGAKPGEGCLGQTLWWAALGGMLGGLIGASSESDS